MPLRYEDLKENERKRMDIAKELLKNENRSALIEAIVRMSKEELDDIVWLDYLLLYYHGYAEQEIFFPREVRAIGEMSAMANEILLKRSLASYVPD